MTPKEAIEIKPCPFCGGEADLLEHSDLRGGEWYYIECHNVECDIRPHTSYCYEKGAAAEMWNRRTEE